MLTKMDMCWIAAATLIYPRTEVTFLISKEQIDLKVKNLFREDITPIMLTHHLVSWQDRQADKSNPGRGGSRNRYFFRTRDGLKPADDGRFRLYKPIDKTYDGKDKTGKSHPDRAEIPHEYHYLLDWYDSEYFK